MAGVAKKWLSTSTSSTMDVGALTLEVGQTLEATESSMISRTNTVDPTTSKATPVASWLAALC